MTKEKLNSLTRQELIDFIVSCTDKTSQSCRYMSAKDLLKEAETYCEEEGGKEKFLEEARKAVIPIKPEVEILPPTVAADPGLAAMAKMLEPYIGKHMQPEEIKSLIDKTVTSKVAAIARPTLIEVKRTDGSTYKPDGAVHKQVHWLISLIADGEFIPYLYGAPGSGKSHAVKQVADALGLAFSTVSLSPQSTKTEIVGLKNPLSGEVFGTEALKRIEEGGVLFWDEFDNSHPVIQTTLNTLLAQGYMDVHGRMVNAHKDFRMVYAGNTAGRGGSRNHSNRMIVDGASRSRAYYILWEYDHALEDALVGAANVEAKSLWLPWVRDVRKYTGLPDAPYYGIVDCGMREALLGAHALRLGARMRDVADSVIFRGCPPDIKKNVVSNCPFP